MKITKENQLIILNAVISLSEFCSERSCNNCPLLDEYGRCDLTAIEGADITDLKERLKEYDDGT